jgi:hypothetical protein
MAIVYSHIRLDTNEVFYIGIGKTEKRAYWKYRYNAHWNNIVNKTGYSVEILFRDLSWEDACIKERELISFYGRGDIGNGSLCNHTDGGDGVINMSEESRHKISESKIGKKRLLSDDAKERIRLAHVGKHPHRTHKKHKKHKKHGPMSEEAKLNMAKSKIGRKCIIKKIECPHCGLIGGKAAMHRWHFEKCKHKTL